MESTVGAIVERRYTAEQRLTIDVTVHRDGELVASTFALNEASVEKAARERMLEVVVEIDGRPLSRFGCDGVVCATPTGSTAYNFSAGGPVVWPGVEALLMVPISAHALFARPLVVAPSSVLAVEVLARTEGAGVLWCDGRRTVELPPGARIEVRRGARPGHASCGCTRHRSPTGWSPSSACRSRAGAAPSGARTAMLEEIRITSLGVIESSTLELGPGLTVITGETGAGKTMLVTALGLLLGGRADTGTVRTGAKAARVEGVVRVGDLAWFAAAIEEAGGAVEDDRVVLARNVSAEGRSRAFAGGASVPVSVLAELAEPLVAVHGQSDQHRLLAPRAQRDALDRFAGDRVAKPLARYVTLRARLLEVEAELTEVTQAARERAREADLLRFGLDEIAAVEPRPGEDTDLAAEEARLGYADTLRAAAERAREALSSDQGTPDALAAAAEARTALDSVRDHDTEAGELADRLAELTYLLSDLAADVASYASGLETDPARLAGVSERRAALTALTRKYGDTIDEVLGWAEQSSARLLELDDTDGKIERLREEAASVRADLAAAATELTDARTKAAARLARAGLPGADPAGHAGRSRHRGGAPARGAGRVRRLAARRQALAAVRLVRGRRGRDRAGGQRRFALAPARQGGLGRRAVPGDAGHRGRPRRHQSRCRRSSSTRWTPASAAGPRSRSADGWPSWPGPPRSWS